MPYHLMFWANPEPSQTAIISPPREPELQPGGAVGIETEPLLPGIPGIPTVPGGTVGTVVEEAGSPEAFSTTQIVKPF